MTPHPELKARILASARREPSATRHDASKQTAFIVATAIAVDLGLFFLLGGVHRGPRSAGFVLATQGGSCLVALGAVWGAFGRGRSMLGRPRAWLVSIALLTPVLLFSWILSWHGSHPETVEPGRIGLRCLAFTLGLAAWPLVLITRSRREQNPTTPFVAGAARGAAIGGLAWVLVELWCPLDSPAHLALGHVLPLLLLSALGGWLGMRMTAVRSQLHLP